MAIERWRTMRRQRHAVGVAQRIGLHETSDTEAARGVGLQHVHGTSREHAVEIEGIIAVFAGGDLDAGGAAFTHQTHAGEIVAGDRLLEIDDAQLADDFRHRKGLFAILGAVGIDKQ
jgi:hypothetical protein